MKILYIHQHFTTPEIGGGTRSYEFSKFFIGAGHKVVIVTSHNSREQVTENIDGIQVIWIPNFYDNQMNTTSRIVSYAKFMLKSLVVSLKQKNIDICYATSTPLTVGITAIFIKLIKRVPYVFEVRDLWPEFPIQMGALPGKSLQRFAYWFEKVIYRYSETIVALSPGMADGVNKYNLGKKVITVPNSADLNLFYPHQKSKQIQKKYKLDDVFSLIYFGTLGRANGVDYLIKTAKWLTENEYKNYRILIVGKGQQEKSLKELVNDYQLNNVIFPSFLPKNELAELVNCCDASITTFIDLPVLYTNSPNKLFDSLSAGKVCFVNSNGWTKDLLENNDCGYFVDPHNPSDLAKKMIHIRNNPDLQKKMEKNSRLLAERKFDRQKLASQVLNELVFNAK